MSTLETSNQCHDLKLYKCPFMKVGHIFTGLQLRNMANLYLRRMPMSFHTFLPHKKKYLMTKSQFKTSKVYILKLVKMRGAIFSPDCNYVAGESY